MDEVKFIGTDDGESKNRMSRAKKLLIVCAVLVVILVIVIVCVTQLLSDKKENQILPAPEPWLQLRLPTDVTPTHYNLSLDVDVVKSRYTGNVSIHVSVRRNTNYVLLHALFMKIPSAVIEDKDGKVIPIRKTFTHSEYDFLVIETSKELKARNVYTIHLSFSARITLDLSGFHRGYYKDNMGEDVKIASTFFSPISARRAFPCFDEPSFKATFQITLTYDNKYTALSNMPEEEKLINGDQTTSKFQSSIKMSTYIVCWAILDFDSVSVDAGSLKLKGWLPRNKNTSELIYGLNATAVLLPKYEEYFDIPFPLNKLDVVALPQFGPSAMENWGLILFRDSKFLRNDKSTLDDEKAIVQIMGHELVHQWFGNLATMKFWNEVWLKEGFATYVSYIVFNEAYPSKDFMKDILPAYMLDVMDQDSYASSLPISREVSTSNEIREMFDAITYFKGCCIVQTMYWYMGKDAFRKGIQNYLKTFSYGNADQDGLWKELSKEANGKDIKAVFDTWTKQIGYPVISTKRVNRTHMEIEQKRFTLDPPNVEPPKSPFNYLWQIPIITRDLKTNKRKLFLLKTKKGTFPIGETEILNPDHNLYYRMNYGKKTSDYLTKELSNNHDELTDLDRTGLISDSFYLIKAKLKSLDETIKIINYLKNETEQVVWYVALKEMMQIYELLEEHPDNEQKKWGQFVSKSIEDTANRLGWSSQKHYKDSALQVVVLTRACQLNISSVVQVARAKFREWMKGSLQMDRNLYNVMRDCAISNAVDGDDMYFQYTYDKYIETGDLSLLYSASQTKQIKFIKRLLDDSMNRTTIKTNDAPYVIGNIAVNSLNGRNLAWNFVKENWDKIRNLYGGELFLLGRMTSSVLEKFASREVLADVKSFFGGKTNLGSANEAVKRSLSLIESRITYKEIILEDDWFKN